MDQRRPSLILAISGPAVELSFGMGLGTRARIRLTRRCPR